MGNELLSDATALDISVRAIVRLLAHMAGHSEVIVGTPRLNSSLSAYRPCSY